MNESADYPQYNYFFERTSDKSKSAKADDTFNPSA